MLSESLKIFLRGQLANEHCPKLASFLKGGRAEFGIQLVFSVFLPIKELFYIRIKFMKIIEAQRLNTIPKTTFSKDITKLMNGNSESATRIPCNSKHRFLESHETQMK